MMKNANLQMMQRKLYEFDDMLRTEIDTVRVVLLFKYDILNYLDRLMVLLP